MTTGLKFGNYFIFVFLGVLILFTVVLYTIYSDVKGQTIQDMSVGQKIHAQQAITGIKDYMTNVISMLNFLSNSPEIIEMNAPGKQILSNYQNLNSGEIKGVTRVNARGEIVYTAPYKESTGKDISYQDHIRLSMKTHKTVVSDVFMAVQGFRTIAVHVPVFKNGTFDGTIAFLLSFDKIAQRYFENIRIGANGYAWVISEKGIEISSPFHDHIGKNVYDTYKNFPEIISMVDEMLKGKEGVTVYHYKGTLEAPNEKVLKHASYMPIALGNTFWSIVVAVPEDEIISSLSGFRTNLFLITMALLMICIICMYLIVRFKVVTREQRKREIVLTALQESEAQYRYLFEQNPLPMLIYELENLNLLVINDAFAAHYGYSKTEALALRLPDLYPESEKVPIVSLSKRLQGQAYVGEWHHLKKDGTTITIEVNSHGIQYEGRDSRIAVINDITKRKLAEETLREKERQISSIYDTVGDIIFNLKVEKDSNYFFTSVNQCFLRTTGLKSDQIIGKKVQEVIPEPGLSLVLKKYAEAIREKKIVKWEEVSVYPSGLLIGDVSVAPVVDDSGNCIGLVGSVHDITDRKQFEDTLQKSEELYRTVFENTGTAAVLIEKNTIISLANTEFEKLSRYSKQEIEGKKSWTEFVVKEDLDRMRDQHSLRRENRDKAQKQYEFRFIAKDGELRNILLTIDIIPGTQRSIASLLDITERKIAEIEIQKLNTELERRVELRTMQLEASNKELEAFSYSVSHDLRAPLRHASGFVDLLMKKCKADLSEKGQHYLTAIADSVHQMGMLIDDLLQFSRTGRIEMRQSNSDMNILLQEVIGSLKNEIKNRKIDWITGKLPPVFCDGAMLKLVWVNLLSNAAKFTRTRDEAKIEIGVKEEKSEYIFHVKDNGVGFDMKYAQKLFGVFQRLHSMDEFEGTGIGLANVRRIIGRHGGRTWAEAELDKGAVFYFTLPKNKTEN